MSKARAKAKYVRRSRKTRSLRGVTYLILIGLSIFIASAALSILVGVYLGIALGLISTAASLYIVYRWGYPRKPAILGLVLLASSIALLSMLILRYTPSTTTMYSTQQYGSSIVTPRPSYIETSIGRSIEVSGWRITVKEFAETLYIRSGADVYRARDGYKVVLVRLEIENLGSTKSEAILWNFTLTTSSNKSYTYVYPAQLIEISNAAEDIASQALNFTEFNRREAIDPKKPVERHIMFQIPLDEQPLEFRFYVGLPHPTKVVLKLTDSSLSTARNTD